MNDMILGILSQPVWVFMSVLARISPTLMIAPPTRSGAIPMRVRALIAIAAAFVATPMAFGNATRIPGNVINIALAMSSEVLLGMLLGSIVMLSVLSLQVAGQAASHLAGFDLANSADPASDEQMPVVSTLLGWLAIVILLIVGGHRQMMECCLDSFARYPAGAVVFEAHWLQEFRALLSHSFVIGIRAAAPMATALLLSNLITGLLARTLPQLNVLAIGFNINAMALLLLISLAVGGVAWVFQTELSVWLNACHRIVLPLPE
ncbi:MAG: flagellar biosynthetic protein FliR [Aureliella sp.]